MEHQLTVDDIYVVQVHHVHRTYRVKRLADLVAINMSKVARGVAPEYFTVAARASFDEAEATKKEFQAAGVAKP